MKRPRYNKCICAEKGTDGQERHVGLHRWTVIAPSNKSAAISCDNHLVTYLDCNWRLRPTPLSKRAEVIANESL